MNYQAIPESQLVDLISSDELEVHREEDVGGDILDHGEQPLEGSENDGGHRAGDQERCDEHDEDNFEELKKLCATNSDNEWCKRNHPTPKPPSPPKQWYDKLMR